MKSGSLTLVPSGGLANRMYSIVSAYNLCQKAGVALSVIWFKDRFLSAGFSDIFRLMECDGIRLRDGDFLDYIVNDRPRRKNLYVPYLFQKLKYDGAIYENEVSGLKESGMDFKEWVRGRHCYMSNYQEFGDYDKGILIKMFRPVDEVMSVVNRNVESFSNNTIGIHIRRPDHIIAIRESPTYLFINKAKEEITRNDSTKFYLATDDLGIKEEFKSIFGDRMITMAGNVDRSSVRGIRGGLVDMWTLSMTKRIYGSANSTFSMAAAAVGNTGLIILRK